MTLPRVFLVGLLTFCFIPLCAAQRPQAGHRLKQIPLDTLTPYGQRTDAFRRLLCELSFWPLSNFARLQANPSESILIVLGDPNCLSKRNFPEGLRSFVERGGAVLIATDKETNGEAGELLGELAGVRVTGEKLVYASLQPANIYNLSFHCPFVQPDTQSTEILNALATIVPINAPPDLFRNPNPDRPTLGVASNAPSRLRRSNYGLPGEIYQLASLPPACLDESKVSWHLGIPVPNEKAPQQRPSSLFAVGGVRGKGRVLVLADHSIFINRMMLPRDNGNLEFAANCLHYLRGGVSSPMEAVLAVRNSPNVEDLAGKRNMVLLCDDGSIVQNFNIPLQAVPLPPPPKIAPALVAALDQTVTRMEDENIFNRAVDAQVAELAGGWTTVVRSAVFAVTATAILILAYLLMWRDRPRHESAAPLLALAVRNGKPKATLLEQRRRALQRYKLGRPFRFGSCLASALGFTLRARRSQGL